MNQPPFTDDTKDAGHEAAPVPPEVAMSSKRNGGGWWVFAGDLVGLFAQATSLSVPALFAGVIALLLWPFAWLTWHWLSPARKKAAQGFARMLASLFFAVWAMFFAALAVLLFVVVIAAVFRANPEYGAATLAGGVCVVCSWFAYQIGSAIWA